MRARTERPSIELPLGWGTHSFIASRSGATNAGVKSSDASSSKALSDDSSQSGQKKAPDREVYREAGPLVASAGRAKRRVLLEPAAGEARIGSGNQHGVAQAVEASVIRVTLSADEEGRLGGEERDQWGKRAEGDDIQLQPEHVGAMRCMSERTAEDGARHLDSPQAEHTHCSFPPHACGSMRVVQQER
eukprot:scaffold33326_cov242-Isochrysis_galbana.AAC.1